MVATLVALLTLMVACLAAPAHAYVPPPVDAPPCGQIMGQPGGQPGMEIDYCLWPGPAPLLVLLSAAGNDAQSWSRGFVQALNGFAGVLVYDRRGYGQSATPAAAPVTAEATAADLQALLRGLEIGAPVVLVGHGLGGLYAQYYARRFPQQVAAVVLIEPTSPLAQIDDPRFWGDQAQAPDGVATLEDQEIERAVLATRALPPFPPVPLLVLTAADQRAPDFEPLWQQVQAQTAAQSPLGHQVLLRGAGADLRDRPDLVAAQIGPLWRGLDGSR